MISKEKYLEMQSTFYDSLVNPSTTNESSQVDPLPFLRACRMERDHYIEIDFSKKETEAGWQVIVDRFYLNAAPVWFDWLKWIMMVAALLVVAEKSGSPMIRGLMMFSFVLMYFYFTAFFFRVRLTGLRLIGSEMKHFVASLVLSGLFSFGASWCAISLAHAVAAVSK